MATVGFNWVADPVMISKSLIGYEDNIKQGIGILADAIAQKMEGYAKSNAPWNDQTSAARGGLRGFATKTATQVVMYLVHSVFYGPYLELGTSKMAPRPIIVPTLQAHFSEVMARVRELLGR